MPDGSKPRFNAILFVGSQARRQPSCRPSLSNTPIPDEPGDAGGRSITSAPNERAGCHIV